MTIKAFAKNKFDGMDEDDMIDILKENGYLKANGSPKAKYIDEFFDEDGGIINAKGLAEELHEILDEEDESDDDLFDEDDEDEKPAKKSKSKKDEDDEDDADDDEELDFETLKNTLSDFDFDNKDDLAELGHMVIDKLKDFEESDDSDKDDSDDDDDEPEEDDEDPNAPGTYRGWKISKEGIKIIAKKGKKTLTTSVKGNIRDKIDEVED